MNEKEIIAKACGIIGRIGGRVRSPKKASAARRNGKLGGRPKKKKTISDKNIAARH